MSVSPRTRLVLIFAGKAIGILIVLAVLLWLGALVELGKCVRVWWSDSGGPSRTRRYSHGLRMSLCKRRTAEEAWGCDAVCRQTANTRDR